ncbi:hypothetical protein, partial [Oceanithermus profundus]
MESFRCYNITQNLILRKDRRNMHKGTRIAVFIITVIALALIFWFFRHPITALGERAVIIFSALIMLSFTTFLIEHYFTKPTDTLASAISVLLMMAPAHSLLADTGIWYNVILAYNFVLVL